MKYLTLLLFLISSSVFAYPVPKELVDGEITVRTRDGREYKFSSNEYKVVKRGAVKPAPVVFAPVINNVKVVVTYKKPEELKNRFTLLVGVGPSGKLFQDYYEDRVKISTKQVPLFGISYDRKFEDLSLRGTFLTNKTYLFGLGFDI